MFWCGQIVLPNVTFPNSQLKPKGAYSYIVEQLSKQHFGDNIKSKQFVPEIDGGFNVSILIFGDSGSFIV